LDEKDLKPLQKWIIKKVAKLKKHKSAMGENYLFLKAYQEIFEKKKSIPEAINVLKEEKKVIMNTSQKSVEKLFGSLIFLKKKELKENESVWNIPVENNEEVIDLLHQRYGYLFLIYFLFRILNNVIDFIIERNYGQKSKNNLKKKLLKSTKYQIKTLCSKSSEQEHILIPNLWKTRIY
jgi:hypothetical protein